MAANSRFFIVACVVSGLPVQCYPQETHDHDRYRQRLSSLRQLRPRDLPIVPTSQDQWLHGQSNLGPEQGENMTERTRPIHGGLVPADTLRVYRGLAHFARQRQRGSTLRTVRFTVDSYHVQQLTTSTAYLNEYYHEEAAVPVWKTPLFIALVSLFSFVGSFCVLLGYFKYKMKRREARLAADRARSLELRPMFPQMYPNQNMQSIGYQHFIVGPIMSGVSEDNLSVQAHA